MTILLIKEIRFTRRGKKHHYFNFREIKLSEGSWDFQNKVKAENSRIKNKIECSYLKQISKALVLSFNKSIRTI